MTKLELIDLLKQDMTNSLVMRDNVDSHMEPEAYGYHNGQFRTYESVINTLLMFQVIETRGGDSRNIRT